jgi:uncharacterized YigZ family protein
MGERKTDEGYAMNAYKTLQSAADSDYIVQKSRFIGHAAPVAGADGALVFLEKIKRAHRDASHNCFAYIIGQNRGIIRYGDDGEPSGTAGKPILEMMTAKAVVDCAVVVTRYFGGILLGSGGLVRAYAHTASLALDAAGICTMHETGRWHLNVAYPLWDRVEHTLKSLPAIVESTVYADSVKVILLSREINAAAMIAELMKTTDGKIETAKEKETFFHPWGD